MSHCVAQKLALSGCGAKTPKYRWQGAARAVTRNADIEEVAEFGNIHAYQKAVNNKDNEIGSFERIRLAFDGTTTNGLLFHSLYNMFSCLAKIQAYIHL